LYAYKCKLSIEEERMSWVPRLERNGEPLYRAIVSSLASDVASGRIKPGARLPTQRDLAKRLGVNLTTVTRAFTEARRLGLVSSSAGRGTFVRTRGGQVNEGSTVIDLSANVPPQMGDTGLSDALSAALSSFSRDRGALAASLEYGTSGGANVDREAGAAWLALRGLAVPAARVTVTAGAQQALLLALMSLTSPGDLILVEELTYPGFKSLAESLRLRIEGIATDSEGVEPDAFRRACRRRPKMLFCCPTLQNPTASIMSLGRRKEIIAVARELGVIVLEDDVYGPLPTRTPSPIAALAPDITVYVTSMSKCVAPGLRVGYMVAPEAEERRIAAELRGTTWMTTPLTCRIAARWIADGTAASAVVAIRKELEVRQAIAARCLAGADLAAHHESPHLWLRLPAGKSRVEYVERVRRLGVVVAASDAFSATSAPDAVRVCLGAAPDRETLTRALEILAATLNESSALGRPLV